MNVINYLKKYYLKVYAYFVINKIENYIKKIILIVHHIGMYKNASLKF